MDNSTNRQYTKYTPSYIKDEDAYQGQEEIKAKTTTYLPMLPAQKNDPVYGQMLYDIYSTNALWFPATGATVRGYLGIMFRKEPTKTIPADMSYVEGGFGDGGESLDSVAKNLAKDVIIKYRPAVLVDFPDVDTSGMTLAAVESIGLSPYAVLYDSLQIVDWHERIGGGVKVLDFVKIKELHDAMGFRYAGQAKDVLDKALVSNGQYIVYRVLKLEVKDGQNVYTQEVYIQLDSKKKKESEEDFVLISKTYPMKNNQYFDYIPIVPCSEDGMQWDLDYSLVNDLVNLNIADYRNEALYRDNLLFLARPTICVKGYIPPEGTDGKTVSTGSSSVWQFDTDGGHSWLLGGYASQSAALVESGNGLKAQMSTIGMRSLAADPNGVEASETAAIHRSGEHGTLSSVANAVSDRMTRVLEIMQDWTGGSGTVSYEVSTDFIPQKIDATLLSTLWQMYVNGDLPLSQLIRNLKAGEVVDPAMSDEDYESKLQKKPTNEPAEVVLSTPDIDEGE